MQLNPYLTFNGKCEAAFKFYEQVLGGKIEMLQRFRGTPAAEMAPPEAQDNILHVSMTVDGMSLMGSDAPGEYYTKPEGFSVSLGISDPAEAERIFNALSKNGTVKMPLQQTFWAQRFGMCIDQFDIPWIVNCQ